MKKTFFSFALVALFLSFGAANAQNLVQNGDLESWTAGIPDYWDHVENITQESTIVYSGTYSAKHTSASSTTDFGHEKIVGITAGNAYTLSYYYYDNDVNARTRVWSKWLDDAGTTIGAAIESEYSVDSPDWMHYSNNLVAPVGATQFYLEVRVYKGDAEGGSVYYDEFSFSGDQTVYPEPTNYPTAFTAAPTGLGIHVGWTESVGDQLPAGYLLLGKKTSGGSFTVPVDGTPVENDLDWADNSVSVNVGFGIGGYSFDGLEANASYTFTIYPYTNSGSEINYKTDGTVPESSATTSNLAVISHEGFDAGLGNWTPFSVTGDQVWEFAPTYGNPPGCAKGNGFAGAAVENEDWLISPKLDLTGYLNITFGFDHARNYATNDGLYVMISTDYPGSGDPTSSTWIDLTASYTFPDPGSWTFENAGTADISAYTTDATYIAFVYNSTDTDASTWEVDNADVLGVLNTGIDNGIISQLTVYPNPASDQVTLIADEDAQALIINLMGQTVKSIPVVKGANQIALSDLTNGMYIVKIAYQNGTTAINQLMVK
ncbi:MAG: choice-of-anchor J domain-containing protein [Bacteroidales bacterium]|jgi:hypothetical protein